MGSITRRLALNYGHLVADLLSAKKASKGQIPKYALFDLARLCEKLDQNVPDLGGLRMLVSNSLESKKPHYLKISMQSYVHTKLWVLIGYHS